MTLQLREHLCQQQNLPRTDAVLLGRAELLNAKDRALVEAVLVQGQSTRSLAELMGVSAETIRQRVRKLSRRMTSKDFLNAARCLPYLSHNDETLARRYFCQGIPQRELAKQLGVTHHEIRRRLDFLKAEIKAIMRMRQGGLQPRADFQYA